VQLGDFRAPREVEPSVDNALEAVCMKAMATNPHDRYATCRALAEDVERWMADEPVSAYHEPLSRRARRWAKRNRTAVATVMVALLAGVVGLSAVLVVQTQAKADIARALLHETRARTALVDANIKVQARYDLALQAIKSLHTGVSEDMLLKNAEFKDLRTKLLKEAADFYDDLKKLLEGQSDAKSRQALAAAYFQLGELTDKIGDKTEALAVHRKALALRRELAAAEGADAEARLDVARSLRMEGTLLYYTGDLTGALRAAQEQRDIATALEAESATDAVRAVLAQSHLTIGTLLRAMGKRAEALTAWRQALAIQQKLADASPAVAELQQAVAKSHFNIGTGLAVTEKAEEAMTAFRKALAIFQKLADANPADAGYQFGLARCHFHIGNVLRDTGKPAEALPAFQKALAIYQKLTDADPAVTEYHFFLAVSHNIIGEFLSDTGKPAKALQAHQKALAILQKLADANPAVNDFQSVLARSHDSIGWCLLMMGRPVEGAEACRKASGIIQKLLDDNPANTQHQLDLANFQTNIGRGLARQNRWPEAFSALERALVIRQKLAAADPNDTSNSRGLGEAHTVRAGALAHAGQPAEAAADLRKALELYAKGPHLNINSQVDRSRALALLAGLGGDAKSSVTKDEAKAFADQSVAALADAVKAGWALPSELKEPDFDALRGRADFQKLVAEVEAKVGQRAKERD
jgi:serine/threonine-protein kinase